MAPEGRKESYFFAIALCISAFPICFIMGISTFAQYVGVTQLISVSSNIRIYSSKGHKYLWGKPNLSFWNSGFLGRREQFVQWFKSEKWEMLKAENRNSSYVYWWRYLKTLIGFHKEKKKKNFIEKNYPKLRKGLNLKNKIYFIKLNSQSYMINHDKNFKNIKSDITWKNEKSEYGVSFV